MHIYIFGPSCSGKSTLCQALQKSLGRTWSYIDRDVLIESGECSEADADGALENRIDSLKGNVIVDAQIPWRKKEKKEHYFLVLPPLTILLERDAERTRILNRSEERARYAKDYVISTHHILSKQDPAIFDHCFDSSALSVAEEVETIKTFLSRGDGICVKYSSLVVAGLAFSLICLLFIKHHSYFLN